MGASSSRRRLRDDYYPPPPPPPHHYSSYPPPPPPPHHHHHHHQPPPPPPNHHHPPPPPPHHHHRHPPPPPPHAASYYYYHHPPPPHAYHGPWHPAPLQPQPQPPALTGPPPEFVEHQQARKVKNDVNLHKDTIRLVPDDADPSRRLVAFTFDAVNDGSVTIYYFAKEGKCCSFSSVYPELQTPTKIPFQKGLAQRFIQPSGSGVDLGFFSLDELSNPSGEVFPLVVYAKAYSSPEEGDQPLNSTRAQITLAVIEKHNSELQVKVVKQILWIEGVRYELQEIFGIVNSTEVDVPNADDTGKECVICLTEPRDTAVIPCRHLCMCSECAKALRLQSNKCPICRQPVEKLMEIKVRSPEP
ncbi:probable E3 ubiquitin-protein ligase LUL4 [Phragmites australis]|uniref:probable E3 ubiquitin-protein ligase LUL4 n=1 Tax=Phragmites australis TaxID=29695 RepID=UPI002D77E9B1|nr:probable E3 ubiquitin-protein ligase LUL4 [Phragmites australis]XP_062231316.1 probable E3 ubiquitin-protein ligase LUL4 [Phragmites australis]